MKLSFRWYGPDDPVTLANIRQIPGMKHIVSAVYDVPVGQVWSEESITALQKACQEQGLIFDVVESVPVHEDIKLGLPSRDMYTAKISAVWGATASGAFAIISCPFLTGRAPMSTTKCLTAPKT